MMCTETPSPRRPRSITITCHDCWGRSRFINFNEHPLRVCAASFRSVCHSTSQTLTDTYTRQQTLARPSRVKSVQQRMADISTFRGEWRICQIARRALRERVCRRTFVSRRVVGFGSAISIHIYFMRACVCWRVICVCADTLKLLWLVFYTCCAAAAGTRASRLLRVRVLVQLTDMSEGLKGGVRRQSWPGKL